MTLRKVAIIGLGLIAVVLVCTFIDAATPEYVRVAKVLSSYVYPSMIVASVILFHLPLTGLTRPHKDRAGKAVWWSLDLATCAFLLVQAIKYLSHIPRPTGGLQGFPSGHAAYSFALAFLILESYPRLAPLWFGLAVAIGWSRVALNEHYSYQVFAGAVLGLVLGWLVTQLPRGLLFPRCLRQKADSVADKTAA